MTRYHNTTSGDIPFTAEEEAATDLEEAQANAEILELAKTQYQRDRKQEYDKLLQFEMQFDDNRDGTSTWVDSINEIKERFPK
jgi:hypothetical protein